MILATSKPALEEQISAWKNEGLRIGFVPTMGALHDGHLSLCAIAARQCDKLVVSIFVNPTQFAAHEDLGTYPRHLEKDKDALENQGLTHLIYAPRVQDIYPSGPIANLKAGEQAKGLESDFRPHFFDGVVSVVHTLFHQVRPDIAVFGEKDFQQLKVIEEMVHAQKMNIDIIGADIVRDAQGLALSSRNAYLSTEELEIARMLNQIIYDIGHCPSDKRIQKIAEAKNSLLETGFDKIDYVEERWGRILAAVWLGKTRLIDNCPVF